jgi:hypothetical protein
MSLLGLVPVYRLTDSNNVIVPNGRLYTFLTGTLTAAPTYTTSALDVSHGAYVQANSAGLLPSFYYDPAVSYRAQVRAAPYTDAVPGMDFDPINGATGIASPTMFGVTGNPDDTDDTATLQAWLDYCADNGLDAICEQTLICRIGDEGSNEGSLVFTGTGNIDVSRITFYYDGSRDRPALIVPNTPRRSNKTLRFGQIRPYGYPGVGSVNIDWSDDDYVGLQLNDLYGCSVHLQNIAGFTRGYECVSTLKGFAYNEIYPGSLWDNKYNEVLRTAGDGVVDFVNENTFYSGNYSQTSNVQVGFGNALGTLLTWDKVASTRGQNNNVWVHPCYELGQPADTTYRVPFLFDGVGGYNRVISARHESSKGPFAILDGGGKKLDGTPNTSARRAILNTFDIAFNENIAQTNALLEVNGAYGNVMTGVGGRDHRWRSPDLGPMLSSTGGANAPYLRGPMFLMATAAGTPVRALSTAGAIATARNSLIVANGSGVFIALDTTLIKTFEVLMAAVPSFRGRLFIAAFDAAGARISSAANATDATWGDEPYLKGPQTLAATTDYGAGWISGADAADFGMIFTVREEVKKIYVGYVGGTAALAIQSLEIIGHSTTETPANTEARAAMRAFADLDDDGACLLATAKPDTAGTHGYYAKGVTVLNSGTTGAAATAGWQCSTAGWLAAAWTITTAYAILGRIVTNDTGKIYELITAGTSAGSGGPTGTGTDITDGTCHWKYIGVKAVFVTLAVTS